MPYVKRKRSTRKSTYTGRRKASGRSRKPGYRKRKSFSKFRPSWTSAVTISPNKRFIYNDEQFSITLTNLAPITSYLFSGNSCYDPDRSGTGVQPYGFDQCCPTFFTTYDVRGSKITVYPNVNISSAWYNKVRCLVVPYHASTLAYTELSDLMRLPGARSVNLTNTGNTIHSRVSSYMSTNKMLGKALGADQSSSALYNANPVNEWYWFVFFDKGLISGDISIYFDVKVTYYTVLSKHVNMNES